MKNSGKMLVLCCAVLLGGCSAAQKASLKISSGEHVLEYGFDPYDTEDEIHPEIMKFISSHHGELDADLSGFDSYIPGEQLIIVTAYGEEDEISEEIKVTVRDTKAPVIELHSDTVYISDPDSFDFSDNIESVYDDVEGDLEILEFYDYGDGEFMLDSPFEDCGFYVVYPETSGNDIKIKIIACDNHGNVTRGEYQVIAGEEPDGYEPKPVAFRDEVKTLNNDPEQAIENVLKDYCSEAGGVWEDGCLVKMDTGSSQETYQDAEEITGALEEDESDNYELYEDESGEEEEWSDEDEEDTAPEEDDTSWEEEENTESDPEQDCYDMGGVWYPGDGCAWPDDNEG